MKNDNEYSFPLTEKQDKLVRKLIDQFKEEHAKNPFCGCKEEYKWKLIQNAHNKQPLEIIELLKSKNLLYHASTAINEVKNVHPKEYEHAITALLDENIKLHDRIIRYRDDVKTLCSEQWKGRINKEDSAAAILTCAYPYKYTFYKKGIYELFISYLDIEKRDTYESYEHYLSIIQTITDKYGVEISKCMEDQLKSYEIKPNILATQTLIWCMFRSKKEEDVNTILKGETMKESRHKQYIDLLKANYNLVLTGAPGTGKTFMARAIAEEMGCSDDEVKFVQFHPSYDYTDFVEGLRPIENTEGQISFERKDGVFKEFCIKALENVIDSEKSIESLEKELTWRERLEQFLNDASDNSTPFETVTGAEFTIEGGITKRMTIIVNNRQNDKTPQVAVNAYDVIELLTNEVPLNNVKDIRHYFNRKFGTQPDSYAFVIVKKVRSMKTSSSVESVSKVEKKPYVFIIDEINRGEASKIFGELFFAIDPGYRGKNEYAVQTQYQNLIKESEPFARGFFVPDNVYIIGTMNDIDRSVDSMDFAMRRRFAWKEIAPQENSDMLNQLGDVLANEAKARMNRLNGVITATNGLGAAYQIGGSYFLKLSSCEGNFDMLWELNLEPLLREYLRGFRNIEETMGALRDAYNCVNKEGAASEQDAIDED